MTQTAVRGCGVRKCGGVYVEVPLSSCGMPFEYFLIDPPVVIDADALGLSPVGVKLIKRPDSNVYDVWDIIGQEHYPNVADFIEEGKRLGLSRRISTGADFSLLTEESKLICLHARAHIDNPGDYTDHEADSKAAWDCPKKIGSHLSWPNPKNAPMCVSLYWQDIDVTEHASADEDDEEPVSFDRTVERHMPSFTYTALARPEGVIPEYKLAIFGSFPIGRLAVINDPTAATHEAALKKARQSQIAVELEDA